MKQEDGKLPLVLQRAFWTLHSLTWDSALTSQDAERRVQETTRWIGELCGSGGSFLDLGCGTGEHSFALADLGYDVTAVDFSGGMLRRAKKKMGERQSFPSFLQINLDDSLPFPDGSFDHALCISVLQCLSSPLRFLHDVRRVLTAGGLLFLRVKADPGAELAPGDHSLTHRVFSPLKRWASSARFVHSFTMDELLEVMARSGFVPCDRRCHGPWLKVVGRAV